MILNSKEYHTILWIPNINQIFCIHLISDLFIYIYLLFDLYTAHMCQHLGAVSRFTSLVLRLLLGFFSSVSDHPFVIEGQVCRLSTKPQVSTTLHYKVTVCCNRTVHSQHCLPASVEARELNLNYALATGKLNPGPFAPAAECMTTRSPRPLITWKFKREGSD